MSLRERRRKAAAMSVVFSGEDRICRYIRTGERMAVLTAVYERFGMFRITRRIVLELADLAFQAILRSLPRRRNGSGEMYSAEHDADVRSPDRAVFVQALKVLVSVVRSNGVCPDLLNEALGEGRLSMLLEMIRSEDSLERASVSDFATGLLLFHPEHSGTVICSISNELAGFVERTRSHVGMEDVLRVLAAVVRGRMFATEEEAAVLYYQGVLRMTGMRFFGESKEVGHVVELFCRSYPCTALLTVRHIARVFERTRCMGRARIVFLVCRICSVTDTQIHLEMEDSICRMIAMSFETEHHVLIEEAASLLCSKAVRSLVRGRAGAFVSKAFAATYRLSKRHWSKQGLVRVLESLHVLLAMDPHAFEESLKMYNRRRVGECREGAKRCSSRDSNPEPSHY